MDVQTIIALTIVGLCGGYVAWKYLRMLLKPESAACHHCAHCPVANNEVCKTACSTAAESAQLASTKEVQI